MNVHPAQLTLEALSGVSLHYLGADVTGGDVLVGVLGELVGGLQHWRRSHCCWWLHTSGSHWSLPSSSLHVLEGVHPLALELPGHLLTEPDRNISDDRVRLTVFTLLLQTGLLSDCLLAASLSCRINVSEVRKELIVWLARYFAFMKQNNRLLT